MKLVIQLEGGIIQNVLTDEPAEVLVLDYDAELPEIDDLPDLKETVIDYDGEEVICDEVKPEIEPLKVNYFFGMHEAQNVNIEYL